MTELLAKAITSLRRYGMIATVTKIREHISYRLKKERFHNRVLQLQSAEDRFTWIYRKNYWSTHTTSGRGSSLQYTQNIRSRLPGLIKEFAIKTVFDAPCGDFTWMRHLLSELDVKYIGGDIVRDLIDSHAARYANATTSFMHIDLIKDRFPNADLMICRDCFFHLSFNDTQSVIRNFVVSEIPYLLTTTHINAGQFRNCDIHTGDFRLIDLFTNPYHFANQPLARIDDWLPPDPERQLCLWTRDQIRSALAMFEKEI